jgi:hypothetical protein
MHPLTPTGSGRRNFALIALGVFLFVGWPDSVKAIILYGSGDPSSNTSAPTGSLTNSGWQFQGAWNNFFLGTPIAPKYFIAAKHIGGNVGGTFLFRGVVYTTVAVTSEPGSDLNLWRICGTFPEFAQTCTNRNESNKSFMVFGRGTQRGAAVTTTNDFGSVKTNGWRWGTDDHAQRWGENVVADTVTDEDVGELLQASFDSNGGANECHLSGGDSSGGLFIKDGAVWKLAGINYAVDGPYKASDTGSGFQAAIFDEGGLYTMVGTNWIFNLDTPLNQAGSFYASRISSHVTWINSVINANVPPEPPILQSSPTAAPPSYVDVANATVDPVSRTITVPLPGGSQFYRLRACDPATITRIRTQGISLVLEYEFQ